jgi:uncharacterized membrane protein YphA (DoxX/SURF4 family)
MTHLPIPLSVLYAGLAGTALALVVASASNKWSPRVFFLLALRLAIGWHFLFEGLYKVQSYETGPTDTNKPFSSEPYFRAAPGPLGAKMRKEFSDPAAEIAAKVRAPEAISPADFAKLPADKQAEKCPAAVAQAIDANGMLDKTKEALKLDVENDPKAIKAAEDKAAKDAAEVEAAALKSAEQNAARVPQVSWWTEADRAETKRDADKARAKAKADAEKARVESKTKGDTIDARAADRITEAKAAYARWVYGVDPRPATVKFISGDLTLTGPQRLEHLEWIRREALAAEERAVDGLGNGTGTESKRVAEFRVGAITAEADLARDANAFIAELKKDLAGGKAVEEPAEESRGQKLDRVTMWFLVAVGAALMAGLFTRLACVTATGFLVMTYLTHPAFPWYPQPPNTEGNPLFINKNVIEALALLTLACYPTGRWLGLDAVVLRPFFKYDRENS